MAFQTQAFDRYRLRNEQSKPVMSKKKKNQLTVFVANDKI